MNKSALAACQADLFTPKGELMERYPQATVEKVIRVREMHQRLMADPTANLKDVAEDCARFHGVSLQTAYADLRVVKELLPALTESKRAFHRWKANEMMMEIWEKAKEKSDLKTMQRVAESYAKYNKIDEEDPKEGLYDQIALQPFVPTDNPEVLGLRRIPNLQEKISELIGKYSRDNLDIEDVSYEETDLEENELFPAAPELTESDDNGGDI